MEKDLKDTDRRKRDIKAKIEKLYEKKKLETPGVTPEDFTNAIVKEEDGKD